MVPLTFEEAGIIQSRSHELQGHVTLLDFIQFHSIPSISVDPAMAEAGDDVAFTPLVHPYAVEVSDRVTNSEGYM